MSEFMQETDSAQFQSHTNNDRSRRIFIFGLVESIHQSSCLETRDIYSRVGHNSGNLVFHYAINRMIGMTPQSVPWSSKPEEVDAGGNLAIMPCANQLGVHADLGGLAQTFRKLRSNVVAIGLGAQASKNLEIPVLPQGTLDWLQQLVEKSPSKHPNITLRGDFTKRVMDHYGFGDHAVTLGCPSLFINKSRDLGARLESLYREKPRKVAIAGGHPDWKSLGNMEASLVRIMEDTRGSYIVQATDELLAVSRNDFSNISQDFLSSLKSYLRLNLTEGQFLDWIRAYFISFYDVGAWMEYLRRFDFVVGARIHGVMLGIQAGIPGLCIAHDSRTMELCQKSKIPYVLADEVKDGMVLDDLISLSNFDGKAFDENRRELSAQYVTFFKNNNLPEFSGI